MFFLISNEIALQSFQTRGLYGEEFTTKDLHAAVARWVRGPVERVHCSDAFS